MREGRIREAFDVFQASKNAMMVEFIKENFNGI